METKEGGECRYRQEVWESGRERGREGGRRHWKTSQSVAERVPGRVPHGPASKGGREGGREGGRTDCVPKTCTCGRVRHSPGCGREDASPSPKRPGP